MSKLGGKKLSVDKQIYYWKSGDGDGARLRAVISCHVDDFKGGGEPELIKKILETISKEFGELKVQWKDFTHCGVRHHQDGTGAIYLDQNEYIKQLRTVDVKHLSNQADTTKLSEADHAKFRTILGALSWCTLTRLDIMVYITALQRKAQAPTKEHLMKCNRVVRWLRRNPFVTAIKLFKSKDMKIIVVSDAAFKKETTAGLSIRGAVLGVGCADSRTPGGPFHVLEAYSRKQRRVTRSTLAAETQAATDAYEQGKKIASAYHILYAPEPEGGFESMEMRKICRDGPLHVPIELCTDCKSLFDMIVVGESGRDPQEATLSFPIDALRQDSRLHRMLRAMYWIDTRDCVTDGLTKGTVARAAIISLLVKSEWVLLFPCQRYTMHTGKTILAAAPK